MQARQNFQDTMYQHQLKIQQQRQHSMDRWGPTAPGAALAPPAQLAQQDPAQVQRYAQLQGGLARYQSLMEGNALAPQSGGQSGEQGGGDAAAVQAARVGARASASAQQLQEQVPAQVQAPPAGQLDGEEAQIYSSTRGKAAGNSPYQIAERGVSGHSGVPVINLNLPSGQKVPPTSLSAEAHSPINIKNSPMNIKNSPMNIKNYHMNIRNSPMNIKNYPIFVG
ncbi:hypothetical protein T484DRAFT_3233539 [Baffinella frigidus]|nr:hypothetical protein T484DRAFT_3233539 [Cryptophyta sp. CCMP2293]